jgi:DNA-binding transcriptional MerR regulator
MAEAEAPREGVNPHPAEPRYKIGDVCRIADVQPYVLRYWESEFPALAPDRAATGPRTYSLKELRIIEQIKRLLYDEGYTIAGAKKRLETESLAAVRADVAAEPAPDQRTRGRTPAKASSPKAAETAPVAAVHPVGTADAPAAPGGARAPDVPPRDPRVRHAIAELKEILRILSSRP